MASASEAAPGDGDVEPAASSEGNERNRKNAREIGMKHDDNHPPSPAGDPILHDSPSSEGLGGTYLPSPGCVGWVCAEQVPEP